MTVFYLLLLMASAFCLGLATLVKFRRVDLIALGLLLFVLVPLIQTVQELRH